MIKDLQRRSAPSQFTMQPDLQRLQDEKKTLIAAAMPTRMELSLGGCHCNSQTVRVAQ